MRIEIDLSNFSTPYKLKKGLGCKIYTKNYIQKLKNRYKMILL